MERPVAVFDIDGSVYRSNMLEDLVYQLVRQGTFPERVAEEYEKARQDWQLQRHRESYLDYMDKLIATYLSNIKGVKTTEVDRAVEHTMRYSEGNTYVFSRDLIRNLKGSHCLLAISGAPMEMLGPYVTTLGFEHYQGSTFEVANGIFTGNAVAGTHHKAQTLFNQVDRIGLTLNGSIGLGDTDNDIPMLSLVDRPIAFNPNKEMLQHALENDWEIVTEHKDTIYHIQGTGLYRVENTFGHYYSN